MWQVFQFITIYKSYLKASLLAMSAMYKINIFHITFWHIIGNIEFASEIAVIEYLCFEGF